MLVHSGGAHGGHYFAYLRPKGDKWFKFDDEMVKQEDQKKAVEDQYGMSQLVLLVKPVWICKVAIVNGSYNFVLCAGEADPVTMSSFGGGGIKYAKQSTAYMLVYIRDSDWDRILCHSDKEDLVEHIRRRLEVIC